MKIVSTIVVYLILILFAVLFILPFIIALSASLTTPENIFNFKLIPSPIDIGNYVKLFSENNVLNAFKNTFLYIVPPVLIGMIFSTTAAGTSPVISTIVYA